MHIMKVGTMKLMFRAAGLLMAGWLLAGVAAAAQQEVSPDHFEATEGKPTPVRKAAVRKNQRKASGQKLVETKNANKLQLSAALKKRPVAGRR